MLPLWDDTSVRIHVALVDGSAGKDNMFLRRLPGLSEGSHVRICGTRLGIQVYN